MFGVVFSKPSIVFKVFAWICSSLLHCVLVILVHVSPACGRIDFTMENRAKYHFRRIVFYHSNFSSVMMIAQSSVFSGVLFFVLSSPLENHVYSCTY